MRPNKLKQMWRDDQPANMGWMSTADPLMAETMAYAGFDAVTLDMQHGMGIGPDRAATWLQAISQTDTVPLVRVPWNDPSYMQWVLDAGAYGVIVPLISTREQAERAGGACRYPPIGYRSVGPNRVRNYAGNDYIEKANDEIVCLVMIEHIDTIGRLDDIAQAPGIDGFYIGPMDLAQTMGLANPGRYADSKEHAEACQAVLDAANRAGLVAGVHCGGPQEALERFEQGFRLCPVLSDTRAVGSAAASALKAIGRR